MLHNSDRTPLRIRAELPKGRKKKSAPWPSVAGSAALRPPSGAPAPHHRSASVRLPACATANGPVAATCRSPSSGCGLTTKAGVRCGVQPPARPAGGRDSSGDRPVRREFFDVQPSALEHRVDLHGQSAEVGDDRAAAPAVSVGPVRQRPLDAVFGCPQPAGAALVRPAAKPAERLSSTAIAPFRARRARRSAVCAR